MKSFLCMGVGYLDEFDIGTTSNSVGIIKYVHRIMEGKENSFSNSVYINEFQSNRKLIFNQDRNVNVFQKQSKQS